MKRILILGGFALLGSVVLLVGSDSYAKEVKSVSLVDLVKAEMPLPITVDYHPLISEFAPAFTSNFCELVVFLDLGSSALCDGYSAVARGPPKSLAIQAPVIFKKYNRYWRC
jgi:hypothetical protein